MVCVDRVGSSAETVGSLRNPDTRRTLPYIRIIAMYIVQRALLKIALVFLYLRLRFHSTLVYTGQVIFYKVPEHHGYV